MTSILQFADVHFGSEDRAALDAVREAARALAPDLVVVCGDITQTGSLSEYEAAARWLASFEAPVLAMPGNHDAPYFQPLARLFAPYGRFRRYIEPLCVPDYRDAEVVVVPLNSARAIQLKLDWSTGVIDLETLDRLVAHHAADARERAVMLACHHPLIYPPESPFDKETANGPEALERLVRAGWSGVLTGHIHIPFVRDRAPDSSHLLSIGAGTLSTRRRGMASSFNHLEVGGGEIGVTAVDFESGALVRRERWTRPLKASLAEAA